MMGRLLLGGLGGILAVVLVYGMCIYELMVDEPAGICQCERSFRKAKCHITPFLSSIDIPQVLFSLLGEVMSPPFS